jgi:hypothetical protein
VASVLLALAGPEGAGSERLEVVDERGRVIWSAPVHAGERFDVSFVHSHERCRWAQHYRIGVRGTIVQEASTFPCFGGGMPEAPPDHSKVIRTPAGYTTAAPLRIGALAMMNWRPAEVTLVRRGRAVRIGDRLQDYERFTIRVR